MAGPGLFGYLESKKRRPRPASLSWTTKSACVVDTKGKEHTHHNLFAAISILPGPGAGIAAAAMPYQACASPC